MKDEGDEELLERLRRLSVEVLRDEAPEWARQLEILENEDRLEELQEDEAAGRLNDGGRKELGELRTKKETLLPVSLEEDDFRELEMLERREKSKGRTKEWSKVVDRRFYDDPSAQATQTAMENVMDQNMGLYMSKKEQILDWIKRRQEARGLPRPSAKDALPAQLKPSVVMGMIRGDG